MLTLHECQLILFLNLNIKDFANFFYFSYDNEVCFLFYFIKFLTFHIHLKV